MAQADSSQVPEKGRRRAKVRSLVTLAIFAAAALAFPIGGVALICVALWFFVRPDVPGLRLARSTET